MGRVFLNIMIFVFFNFFNNICLTKELDAILIRAYFSYSGNYLSTKKLLGQIKSELETNLDLIKNQHEAERLIKIKYELLRYKKPLPKLDNNNLPEINTSELNIMVSINNGESFYLVASSDVTLKDYYYEYLQTGLGKSAKSDLIQGIVDKITKLLK